MNTTPTLFTADAELEARGPRYINSVDFLVQNLRDTIVRTGLRVDFDAEQRLTLKPTLLGGRKVSKVTWTFHVEGYNENSVNTVADLIQDIASL